MTTNKAYSKKGANREPPSFPAPIPTDDHGGVSKEEATLEPSYQSGSKTEAHTVRSEAVIETKDTDNLGEKYGIGKPTFVVIRGSFHRDELG